MSRKNLINVDIRCRVSGFSRNLMLRSLLELKTDADIGRVEPALGGRKIGKLHKNLRKNEDLFVQFAHIFTNLTICEAKIGA